MGCSIREFESLVIMVGHLASVGLRLLVVSALRLIVGSPVSFRCLEFSARTFEIDLVACQLRLSFWVRRRFSVFSDSVAVLGSGGFSFLPLVVCNLMDSRLFPRRFYSTTFWKSLYVCRRNSHCSLFEGGKVHSLIKIRKEDFLLLKRCGDSVIYFISRFLGVVHSKLLFKCGYSISLSCIDVVLH